MKLVFWGDADPLHRCEETLWCLCFWNNKPQSQDYLTMKEYSDWQRHGHHDAAVVFLVSSCLNRSWIAQGPMTSWLLVETFWCPPLSCSTLFLWVKVSPWTWSWAGSQQVPAIPLSLTPIALGGGSSPAFEVDTRDLNLGPKVCIANTFTDWAFSLASFCYF